MFTFDDVILGLDFELGKVTNLEREERKSLLSQQKNVQRETESEGGAEDEFPAT